MPHIRALPFGPGKDNRQRQQQTANSLRLLRDSQALSMRHSGIARQPHPLIEPRRRDLKSNGSRNPIPPGLGIYIANGIKSKNINKKKNTLEYRDNLEILEKWR
ncbi:hypothetical protein [Erwinia persicina]|uniref:hypothetical protein n=1 Tax=Erwinia persicina TaxID=55211 RepID=UPI00177BC262|nr:hypothetical protein [Erwinia persicina]MBD8214478.1 hypothetical protein [Erwinia persicina]